MIVAHIARSLRYGATTNFILLVSLSLVDIVVSHITSIEMRLRLLYLAVGAASWFLADEAIEPLSFIDPLLNLASNMEQKILLGWVLALLFWTAVCSATWFIVLLLRLRRVTKVRDENRLM